MSRRVLIGFILVNVIVSLAVALVVIQFDRAHRPAEPIEGPTQIVILTATPIAGQLLQPAEYQSTIDALQLTSTALAQSSARVVVVTATPAEAGVAVPSITAVATINPALLPAVPTNLPPGQPSPTPPDDGCVRHVVETGDTVFGIAQQYGVYPGDILLVNDMDENTLLRVGDVLIIPVEGCAALSTPTPTPPPTNTPFALTRTAVPVMPAATAVNAEVVIANVTHWGNVNDETVEIRNLGNVVNLQGWTLSNERGDVFRFPEFRMQPNSRVLIFSRQGPNTPAALYWGRETPAWQEGETVTLADSTGQVQATFQVNTTSPLFQESSEGDASR